MVVRVAAMAALLLCAAPADEPASAQASAPAWRARVEATPPLAPVELGAPFELVVKRSWAKAEATKINLEEPFPDSVLAPLVVSLKGLERREVDGDVVETRRYEARAFVREEVFVPQLQIRIGVKSVLPGTEPGPAEPGPGALDPPFPWRTVLWASAGALAAAAALFAAVRYLRKRRRQTAAAAPPPPPPIPPHERALARLGALRRLTPASHEEVQSYYVEASSIVRDYIEERFALRAPEMTTEEFLGAPQTERVLERPHRTLLTSFLGHCDFVKFGRGASTPDDRDRLVTSAERLVQETRHAAEPVGPAPTDSQVIRASEARVLTGRDGGEHHNKVRADE